MTKEVLMGETNLIDLMRVLRRHKILFFCVFGVILLLGVAYATMVAKSSYSATATLSVESLLQFSTAQSEKTSINLNETFDFGDTLNESTAVAYIEYLQNNTVTTVSTPEELQGPGISPSPPSPTSSPAWGTRNP